MALVDEAVGYARLGYSVIPVHNIINGNCSCGSPRCKAKGKHPRFKWAEQQKIPYTIAELIEIWDKHPKANVGIVTGEVSNLVVLDIDGEEGMRSLESAGIPFKDLPISPTVSTGGGGVHVYYRYPENGEFQTKAGVLPKVDIRGKGGFVVAPPSMHLSGNSYEWVDGLSVYEIDPVDADLALILSPQSEDEPQTAKSVNWYERLIAGVREGSRNESATRLAGRYIQRGLSQSEVSFILEAWNSTNTPPLALKEISQVIKSVTQHDDDKQGKSDLAQWVNDTLGMKIDSVKRITGDDPRVIIEFDDGIANISTAQLLSPKNFQQAIAEATKTVTRKLSGKTIPTHDQLAQAILSISTDVDAGIEATEIGEMQEILKDFLSNQRILPEVGEDEEAPAGGAFKFEEVIWFNLSDLLQRSSAKWGIKPTMKSMAQKLKRIGAVSRVFTTTEDSERVVWGRKE